MVKYIECPHCGEMNNARQMRCDDCQAVINDAGIDRHLLDDIVARDQARLFMADFLEFLWYTAPPTLPEIDVPALLSNLRLPTIDLPEVTGPTSAAKLDLTGINPGSIDLPHIDLSNIKVPDIDTAALGTLISSIEFPDVDYAAIGEFISNIDLPDLDYGALIELMSSIDLSDVDLSPLLDLLGEIDFS